MPLQQQIERLEREATRQRPAGPPVQDRVETLLFAANELPLRRLSSEAVVDGEAAPSAANVALE